MYVLLLIMRDYNTSKSISGRFAELKVLCVNNQKLNDYLSLIISKWFMSLINHRKEIIYTVIIDLNFFVCLFLSPFQGFL